MKKFNFNIILFVFAFLFIVFGFNNEYYMHFKSVIYDGLQDIKVNESIIDSIQNTKSNLERISREKLGYHNHLMDIDSIRQNIINTKTIQKGDGKIIKFNNDMLSSPQETLITGKEFEESAKKISELKLKVEESNSKFLYIAVPEVSHYLEFPPEIENFSVDNYNNYLQMLEKYDIPVLNISDTFADYECEKLFFYTDHHWTPYAAFIATNEIYKNLKDNYGWDYREDYCNLDNFNVKTYKHQFLGSLGKRVGQYFSWHGPDDFDLITPKFETNFTEKQPVKDWVRTGKFEDTLLYMENLEKNPYLINTYATYSGGDFRLQIMKNNLNPDGKKILMIRDSYACAIAPFMALNASELHVADLRDMKGFVGEKINVYEYIDDFKPDIVMLLFNRGYTVDESAGRFDFNH